MEYKSQYAWLTNVCLNLTDACNLACRYCFVEQHPHYMSLETAKTAVSWVINNLSKKKEAKLTSPNEKAHIVFFGGEPMLCYDTIIVPLVNWCKEKYPNQISFSITTNGTLLNEERIKWLHDNNFGLLLSIDGAPLTQDFNRPCRNGDSSSELVLKNIPALLHYFPNTTFRSTISQEKVEHMVENYLFAIKLGFKNIFIMPNCREEWSEENLAIFEEQYKQIYQIFIAEMRGQIPFIENTKIANSFKMVLKHDLAVQYNHFHHPQKNSRSVMRCGLGTGMGSVGYDGKIYGCQEQDSKINKNIFLIGNIYEGGINQQQHNNLLQKYHDGNQVHCKNELYCQDCPLCSQCGSYGCPSTLWDLHNSFDILPKIYCQWERIQFQCAATTMKILVNENNQQFAAYLDKNCKFVEYWPKEKEE